MSFFVTKCKGCGKPWAELATDMMLRYRFRRVEAGKAAHSVQGMQFIEEHLHQCPPHAPQMTKKEKKEAGTAKEAQKKPQPSRSGQKETKKSAPTIPAKKSRDAVGKPHRSKKSVGGAALLKATIQHPDSSMDMVIAQLGEQHRISGTTNVGDGIMADAPSCSQPVEGLENSSDDQTKQAEPVGASPRQQLELSSALPPHTRVSPDLPVEMASSTNSAGEAQAPGRAGGSPQRSTERAAITGNASGGDEDEEMENDLSDPASSTTVTPAPPAPAPAPSFSIAVTNSSSGAWAQRRSCILM